MESSHSDYNVDIDSAQGSVIGDHPQVYQTFVGSPPPRGSLEREYFDKMDNWKASLLKRDEAVVSSARTLTKKVLARSDQGQKQQIFQYLEESNLLPKDPKESYLLPPIISLAGADLSGVDMREANLRGVDMREANLRGANLKETNLELADLMEADLGGADLSGAYLWSAILSGANLSGASLSGANLHTANLHGTNLKKTNLRGANLATDGLQILAVRMTDSLK